MKKNQVHLNGSSITQVDLGSKPAVQSVTVIPHNDEKAAQLTKLGGSSHKSSSEWTLRAFFALDVEGKGFLYKKDIISVLRDSGVLEHRSL